MDVGANSCGVGYGYLVVKCLASRAEDLRRLRKFAMPREEEAEATDDGSESELVIETEKETSFAQPSFSLSPQVVNNLKRRGLTVPTQVQLQVIPKIRNERGTDLCVNAPTGSGKTLAYALPIVEVILSDLKET
jgi:superfamily II DNA/RNA helicase